MHQLGKLTKNFVVLHSCNDNKRLSILFLFYSCFYARKMLFRAPESLFDRQCVFDFTWLILLKTTSKWWSMAL